MEVKITLRPISTGQEEWVSIRACLHALMVNVKFTLEQTTKAQRSRSVALLFL
jgi:hypothetical protein